MSRGWGKDKPMSDRDREDLLEMLYGVRIFGNWLYSQYNRVTRKEDCYGEIKEKIDEGLDCLERLIAYEIEEGEYEDEDND